MDLATNSIKGYASFLTGMAGYLVGCEAEIIVRPRSQHSNI
jgi:hypothetical protein